MKHARDMAGATTSDEQRGLSLLLAPHRQADFDAQWEQFRATVTETDPTRGARLPATLPRLGALAVHGARIDEEPRSRR